jgi:hypothetical protein
MEKITILIIAFSLIIVTTISSIQSVKATGSVKENWSKDTIYLNETVVFTAEVNPSSHVEWYLDGVVVQSEYTSSSRYIFVPRALGTYKIGLAVDGITNPMGPKKVTVIAEPTAPTPIPTPTETPTITPTLAQLSVNNLPDQTWLVAVGIGVAAAIAAAAVALTLRRRTPNETANAEPLPLPPPP